MKRILRLILLLAVARGAAADGSALLGSSVSIDDVHLEAARAGEDSQLQFSLRNDMREALVLLAVKSDVSPSSRFMARVGAGEWVEVGSITIPTESVLNLGSSHLRIVFEDIESDLPANTSVPVQLQFTRGSLTVMAHVMGP